VGADRRAELPPTGPMQGVNRARMTMVIVEEDERWAINQFHNAPVIADR
jgi:hypothetical protein